MLIPKFCRIMQWQQEENSYLTILVLKGNVSNSEQISNLYIVFTITFMNKYAHSQLKKIHYFSPI